MRFPSVRNWTLSLIKFNGWMLLYMFISFFLLNLPFARRREAFSFCSRWNYMLSTHILGVIFAQRAPLWGCAEGNGYSGANRCDCDLTVGGEEGKSGGETFSSSSGIIKCIAGESCELIRTIFATVDAEISTWKWNHHKREKRKSSSFIDSTGYWKPSQSEIEIHFVRSRSENFLLHTRLPLALEKDGRCAGK